MKKIILFFFIHFSLFSQEIVPEVLTLNEYFAFIKKFHPVVKQADLVILESDAKLLKSRGAFDPKLEVDYSKKQFKSKEYYNKLNATFKIPVWYGLDVKANFEDNNGLYLNPEQNVPENGLYSLGVSASLTQGLFINNRIAALKQSKLYTKEAKEKRKLLANTILFNAANTYFEWLKAFRENELNKTYVKNSQQRFKTIVKAFELGEKAAIDTLEASILINNRILKLEKSKVKLINSSLNLSNNLWLSNNIPVEIKENIIPDLNTFQNVDSTLNLLGNTANFDLDLHPKIKQLNLKEEGLEIEKKLKYSKLLPNISAQYNFVSPNVNKLDDANLNNFKAGVSFNMPIFLRKERASLKLTKLKLLNVQLENSTQKLKLKNKILAYQQELNSFVTQKEITENLVIDYGTMVKAEERKFNLGESSLFYVITRENKLIDMQLKAIELDNSYLKTKANLFNSLGLE